MLGVAPRLSGFHPPGILDTCSVEDVVKEPLTLKDGRFLVVCISGEPGISCDICFCDLRAVDGCWEQWRLEKDPFPVGCFPGQVSLRERFQHNTVKQYSTCCFMWMAG